MNPIYTKPTLANTYTKSSKKGMVIINILLFLVLIGSIALTILLTLDKQKQIDILTSQVSSLKSKSSISSSISLSSTSSSNECQNIYINNENTKIKITNLALNQTLISPFTLKGQIVGGLCFEATCPIGIFSDNGINLFDGFINLKGEWMTDNLVNFEASLSFDKKSFTQGYILISSSDGSGEPSHCTQLKFPVKF